MSPTNRPNLVSVVAPAKLNLYFDILGKREDNYHEIITVFQAIDLQDVLTFNFTQIDTGLSNKIEISLTQKPDYIESDLFPLDDDCSIAQATKIFLAAMPSKPSVNLKVEVEKNIPIGAGLAGGSTDAAATLIALNHFFNNPFTEIKLVNLASQIGSDVAFCIIGGKAIGRGRGEQLEKMVSNNQYNFIVVKPRSISVSTPWAYKAYDQFIRSEIIEEIKPHSISNILLALKFKADIEKQSKYFWNAFEEVICKEYPILAEIKNELLKLGCITAHLTGSGPTIYGLIENADEGKVILGKLEKIVFKNPNAKDFAHNQIIIDAWLTKTIDQGAHILLSKNSG